MDGWIDIRDIDKCPKCGGHNTTTGEVCLYCSIEKRCKEEPDFKGRAVDVIAQVKAIMASEGKDDSK